MFFKKKKGMIDLRKLQKRGVLMPQEEINLTTDKEGFVDMNAKQAPKPIAGSSNYFTFYGKEKATTTPEQASEETFSTNAQGYDKREVDAKMTDLDNKIYKLEQRIELLERKAGVNQPQGNSLIGW